MPVIVHSVRPPRPVSLIPSCMMCLNVNRWWFLTTLIFSDAILVRNFKERFEVKF